MSIVNNETKSNGSNKEITYVVKEGDTLSSISIANGIPQHQLKRQNKIFSNSDLYCGKVLNFRYSEKPKEESIVDNSALQSNIDSFTHHDNDKLDPHPFPKRNMHSIAMKHIQPKIQLHNNNLNTIHNPSQIMSVPLPAVTADETMRSRNNSIMSSTPPTESPLSFSPPTSDSPLLQYAINPLLAIFSTLFGPMDYEPTTNENHLNDETPQSSSINIDFDNHYIPKLTGEGIILNLDIATQLMKYVPHNLRGNNFLLLYSLLGNGTDLSTFYYRTKKHQNTVLLIKTDGDEVFGGFTDSKWNKNPLSYYGSGDSFVFKVLENNLISAYKWTGLNDFFVWSNDNNIAMGGDGFAFILDGNFISGETYCSKTYNSPILINKGIVEDATSACFVISNIECWGFEEPIG